MLCEPEELCEGDLEAAQISGPNTHSMAEELTDSRALWASCSAVAISWSNLDHFLHLITLCSM